MKLDKADRPKVIILGVLVAVVLGYGAWSLMGKKASAAPASQSVREAAVDNVKKPTDASVPTSAEKLGSAAAAKRPVMVAQLATPQPVHRKDPFANPSISLEVPGRPYSTPRPPLPRLRMTGQLPPFNLRPASVTLGSRPSGSLPGMGAPIAPADPQFTVTGIINGSTNVAIVRAGEERHIVKVGQLINGKYLVRFIGRDRVVLTHGTRSIDLRLGGGTNAS